MDPKLIELATRGLELQKLLIARVDQWADDGFTYIEALDNVREEVELTLGDLHAAHLEERHE